MKVDAVVGGAVICRGEGRRLDCGRDGSHDFRFSPYYDGCQVDLPSGSDYSTKKEGGESGGQVGKGLVL